MDAQEGITKETAAAMAGMDPKTARKYRKAGKLPSEMKKPHRWRTHKDPFEEVWPWCEQQLELSPNLQATTLFRALQRRHPGEFQDGQVRTLQRRLRKWRATAGPPREVYFSQVHEPGKLCASDFSDMTSLGVSIGGRPFPHMLYHFTLTYSNWEWATVCFSETMEALSEGVQTALWTLGGVPQAHRSDQLSAAVHRLAEGKEFTSRYRALMAHYGLAPEKTQPVSPHENGDIERRHGVLKERIDQALMLRGSRDFGSREAYEKFLHTILDRLNAGRSERLAEEREVLGNLPPARLPACKEVRGVRVSKGSLIRVERNRYSVPSRLIGEKVDVRLRADRLEVYYGREKIEEMPRLRGRGKVLINYRHIIDWLVRKPGAFEGYRYRDELFPTSRFRMAYDALNERVPATAGKRYVQILHLAATVSELEVDRALRELLRPGGEVSVEAVQQHLEVAAEPEAPPDVEVDRPDLGEFDALLSGGEVGR
ncbi:MAG: IS21 family transposase [Candidatus Bipolaricaulota bacterium]